MHPNPAMTLGIAILPEIKCIIIFNNIQIVQTKLIKHFFTQVVPTFMSNSHTTHLILKKKSQCLLVHKMFRYRMTFLLTVKSCSLIWIHLNKKMLAKLFFNFWKRKTFSFHGWLVSQQQALNTIVISCAGNVSENRSTRGLQLHSALTAFTWHFGTIALVLNNC